MGEQQDVKVFISWSGGLSKEVAVALRTWLPYLFDRVKPWASDVDIAVGTRGLAQIESELANTTFGIVVVTAANQGEPWVNFEAGALSKTIPGDPERRVVPVLVDMERPTDLTGPLAQLQATLANAEGMKSVIRSVAEVAGIDESVADERFDTYWPRLDEKIKEAKGKATSKTGTPKVKRRPQEDVLDEILTHVRQLRAEVDGPAQAWSAARTLADREFDEDARLLAKVTKARAAERERQEQRLQALSGSKVLKNLRGPLEHIALGFGLTVEKVEGGSGRDEVVVWVRPRGDSPVAKNAMAEFVTRAEADFPDINFAFQRGLF